MIVTEHGTLQRSSQFAFVLALTLFFAVSLTAQSGDTAVALVNTPVYVAPVATNEPLRIAAAGTSFVVLGEEGEWTRVQFQDPQWGRRIGYVASKDLKARREALQPMDLSVKPPPAIAAPAAVSQAAIRPNGTVTAAGFERGWIDVNFGVAVAATKTFETELQLPLYSETATARATYSNPTGAEFDFGGGVMFTRQAGVGISFTGTAHQDTAQLYVNVPHPFAFDAFASDSKPTNTKLQRVEGGVNIQFMVVAPVSPRVRVRLFGGPSYLRVQQDMVQAIHYDQSFLVFLPANAVEITTYDTVGKVEGAGWGFHVGGDVSMFFTRVVGIGAFARFSHATVSLDDPLSGGAIDVKAGGFQAGGGLRLKF